jgi:hypothetical protein
MALVGDCVTPDFHIRTLIHSHGDGSGRGRWGRTHLSGTRAAPHRHLP